MWKKSLLVLLLVGAVAGAVAVYMQRAAASPVIERRSVHRVQRQDLLVSITEGGSLEAVKEVTIVNEVQGQSQIIFLIPEGTYVKQGDLLVELDSSELKDRYSQQQINYQNSLAGFTKANEDLQINKSQNESNIRDAEMAVEFARIDLEKYRDGDWPQSRKDAQAAITIADAELKRSQDRLTWTEQLQAKGYATRAELEADRLTVQRKVLDLEQSREKLRLLERYDNPQRLRKLETEVTRKGEELSRVKVRAASQVAQYEAEVASRRAQLDLQKDKLDTLERQLTKIRITAPQAGLVVYASSTGRRWNNVQIMEGATVRERQELIKLPDTAQMQVEVKVHESRMNQVLPGQTAFIVIDALPDRRFRGRVVRIGVLPDNQMNWMNPDLKVYATEIVIDEQLPHDVKPGLSARAEIIIAKLHQVLAVPIQTVTTIDHRQVCYRVGPQGEAVPVNVEVGLYNDTLIEVKSGLQAGDTILLNPPVVEASPNLGMSLVEAKEVTAKDTVLVPPPTAPTEPPAVDAADLERRFETFVESLPEDRRERMRERWKTMSDSEKTRLLQRGNQPRSEGRTEGRSGNGGNGGGTRAATP